MASKSRKLSMVQLGLALVSVGYALTYFAPIAGSFPTFVGAVMGLVGLYLGGNVASQHVAQKAEAAAPVDPPAGQ